MHLGVISPGWNSKPDQMIILGVSIDKEEKTRDRTQSWCIPTAPSRRSEEGGGSSRSDEKKLW